MRLRVLLLLFAAVLAGGPARGQERPEARAGTEATTIDNWPAPLLWSPAHTQMAAEEGKTPASLRRQGLLALPTSPLPLIAIAPCRIADTRGNGFTGAYGPPSLPGGSPRNFTLTGQCGIAGTAQAVSLNVTVTNTAGPGFILIYPQGGAQPVVSTLNYGAGQTVANAAVVALGTGGGITVVAGVSGTDLILDTNGYYDNSGLITSITAGTGLSGGGTSGNVALGIAAGGVGSNELATGAVTSGKLAANAVTAGAIASGQVVKSLNGLFDGVTLAAGPNVTITPSAQTLTIASTGSGVPSGAFVLGNPGDTTLIGAGFSEDGPALDAWKPTATAGAPTARNDHTAVWTGTKMIVWGGQDTTFTNVNTGGQYDPAGNSWTATTTTG